MRDHRQVVNGVSRRLRAGAHRPLNSRQLAREPTRPDARRSALLSPPPADQRRDDDLRVGASADGSCWRRRRGPGRDRSRTSKSRTRAPSDSTPGWYPRMRPPTGLGQPVAAGTTGPAAYHRRGTAPTPPASRTGLRSARRTAGPQLEYRDELGRQTRPVSTHFLCSHGCRPGGVAIRSRFTTGSAASDFGQWPGAQPWVTSVVVVFFVLARVGAPSAQKITPVTMKTASGTASVSR